MGTGHRPTELDITTPWVLEGRIAGPREPKPTRIHVDPNAGTILTVGDVSGAPDHVLPDSALIFPGFVDIHVHCRDDPSGDERYKEDFDSASRAALHGGVVLVGDMPNNPRPPRDAESYRQKRALADAKSRVSVVLYGAVDGEPTAIPDPIPFKCYYGPSVGSRCDEGEGHGVDWERYRGRFVAFHAESPEVLTVRAQASTHEERRPPEAEIRAVTEILALAEEHGFRPHIAHLSTAGGLEEIRRARGRGLTVSCEVTPHHLFFDHENRHRYPRGEWLQMNPPLRSASDRKGLLEGLHRGEIDAIATDHAPHSLEENARGISGVPHLDTFGPFLSWLQAEGFSWELIIQRASLAPARLFSEFTDRGPRELVAGAPASFSVIDTASPWTVRSADLSTRAGWSPFEGVTFPGSVLMTAVRGRIYVMR